MDIMLKLAGWGTALMLIVLFADVVELFRCKVYEEKSATAVLTQRKILKKALLVFVFAAAYLAQVI